jgi:tRNA pseudouridine-54 N-methylase
MLNLLSLLHFQLKKLMQGSGHHDVLCSLQDFCFTIDSIWVKIRKNVRIYIILILILILINIVIDALTILLDGSTRKE